MSRIDADCPGWRKGGSVVAKLLVFVASVPVCLGLMWAARQVGVPRPWDISVVMFIGLMGIVY